MTASILGRMIDYFGTDRKRIHHALKVYGYAKAIIGMENAAESCNEIIELAAALHDIGIHEAERKYQSSAGRYQELEGPPIAEEILRLENIDQTVITRVCYLIGNHHSYSKIDGLDFQILVEADFLVNIEEDELDKDAIQSIYSKIFKTTAGKHILKNLYSI